MTSIRRNLAVLLLFLSTSPLLHSHLFTHAATASPPVTYPKINYIGDPDDLDDPDDLENHSSPPVVPKTRTTLHQVLQLCHYNPCLENEMPCEEEEKKTGCLCPGISGRDEPPHAPRLETLKLIREGENSGKVEVKWCAPSSTVSGYRVVIQGNEGYALEYEDMSRKGFVGSLEAGTKVCVEAVNKAGHSEPTDFSCKRYNPPDASDHNLLAAVIGGGIAFLLLLIIAAVVLWKYQMCQKSKRDSTDGLGNPSYSTEGTL